MGTPEELAAFHVRTAVAVARLDEALGPDDQNFRGLVINELVDGLPVPCDFARLYENALRADHPITAMGEALTDSFNAAASTACAMIVEEAVVALYRAGGEKAVKEFLADLEARANEHVEDPDGP